MKKLTVICLLAIMAVFVSGIGAHATPPPPYTYEISIDPIVDIIPDNNPDLPAGYDWYKWTYKISVVGVGPDDPDIHNSLSHWNLGLEDCWFNIEDEVLRQAVINSIGYDGNDPDGSGEQRTYIMKFEQFGAADKPDGFEWTPNSSDVLDDSYKVEGQFAEYDFFWFSVPTNQTVSTQALLKYGKEYKYVNTIAPDCPECGRTPEPASMLLLGTGLLGVLGLRKKQ
ncbi:MAG: PEP-CTERM sorting domain-containing protein [Candidatus Omnitrophota bacterium]|jgi:hypothetical protein